ncbi:MAG TPA: RelA/SpoT family protein [Candidatus Eisenbacteria bacterium]|nr:RelA/SpoT family protein [Candidatus Eisenbacteria bacterium]
MEARIDNLLASIRRYNPKADTDMVRLAFEFAENAHKGQMRSSGEPYIIHPVKAAEILAEMRLPTPMIIAGLLHDVPEDTAVTLDDISKNFGDDVASMVAGITKLGKIKYRGIDRYIENLRKMFVAMASDVRVILVKFADRIHNLETLDALPPNKRIRIALESLEIYAPIANRLGMNEIRTRLEDLSFRHAMPKEYEWVKNLAASTITVKKSYIDRVREIVIEDLKKANVPFTDIQGRVKHLYSLYQKLLKHERDIVQIHDLVALRVIVPNVGDCYATLGIIHQRWKPLKGRIKDYISQPKPNGYQSLHTTVFCENGEIVEFQIRTQQMHDAAERGIAAHWHYDEDGKRPTIADEDQLAWVRDLAEHSKHVKDKAAYIESLESMKIDVFQNRIFVFTPKGDVIDLPEGATPVDFAYAIHTHIGNTCVGARVNDQIVSLDSKLSSGDFCEIIVDKNRKSPNPDWLTFVKTGHARSHIRSLTKTKLNKWIKDLKPDDDEERKFASVTPKPKPTSKKRPKNPSKGE